MANEYMSRLTVADEMVASIIRKEHAEWLATIEKGLGESNRGLDELYGTCKASVGDFEKARVLLAIRAFRSLRGALNLLECGYNQQAGGLIRMAMEDLLVVEDIATHPSTLSALLHGSEDNKERLGRGELGLNAMAGRLSPDTKKAWKEEYDSLSVFATHPRAEGLATLVAQNQDGVLQLAVYGHYNRRQLSSLIELTAKQTMFLMKTVADMASGVVDSWLSSAAPAFQALDQLIDEVRKVTTQPEKSD
ncbi:MAG: hypothetical protein OXC55_00395 [Chloroflexi bacterium]|nr:hypothetical protein [Chloroflexota bacterium]